MKPLRFTWFVCWGCARCVGTLVLWTSWLALIVLLACQLHIALSRELAAPGMLLRKLEARLAAQGLRVKFGQTRFDPTGRVELRDVVLSTTTVDEPLVSADSVRFCINPLALALGGVSVDDLQISGARLHAPAMVSPSGRNEPLINHLEVAFSLEGNRLDLAYLTARLDNLTLSARGAITLPPRAADAAPLSQVLDRALERYFVLCRQLARLSPELAAFDQPRLDIALTPHAEAIGVADISLHSAGAHWPAARFGLGAADERVQSGRFAARLKQPLRAAGPRTLDAIIEGASLDLPRRAARDFRVALRTVFPADGPPVVKRLTAVAASVAVEGVDARDVVATIVPGPFPRVRAEIDARALGALWSIAADADLDARSGVVELTGEINRTTIAFAGARAGRDFLRIVNPENPAPVRLNAVLAPGWKLDRVRGAFDSGPVDVRTVAIAAARCEFDYDGREVRADRIFLHAGGSEVRGSYWMNAKTLDYRFLLVGSLQPEAIDGWFHEWWTRFWANFDFRAAAPAADIDVRGRWGDPSRSAVYVHVDSRAPVIRTVPLDHVRIALFVRPDFYDALELFATRGTGSARGTFTRSVDLRSGALRRMDFSVVSDLELRESARIFGRQGTEIVEPFVFEAPPKLTLTGRLDGPASGSGEHQTADIAVSSQGAFDFHGFPLRDLAVRAHLADDDLRIDELDLVFAGGRATGRARLSGPPTARRLGFDVAIDGANLGRAIGTLEKFGSQRKGESPPPQSKFQQRVADGRLGLRLSADGYYSDLYSFQGSGSAEIDGAELAEINLLGALSRVLNFTSLRLDSAHANFKLEGNKLQIPELRISGPTAAIDARGLYRLDVREMEFNARVYPFEESHNLLGSAIDFVLTPLSRVLELKLTGSLERPDWRFAFGPTSFLRSLAGEKNLESRSPLVPVTPPPTALPTLPALPPAP